MSQVDGRGSISPRGFETPEPTELKFGTVIDTPLCECMLHVLSNTDAHDSCVTVENKSIVSSFNIVKLPQKSIL